MAGLQGEGIELPLSPGNRTRPGHGSLTAPHLSRLKSQYYTIYCLHQPSPRDDGCLQRIILTLNFPSSQFPSLLYASDVFLSQLSRTKAKLTFTWWMCSTRPCGAARNEVQDREVLLEHMWKKTRRAIVYMLLLVVDR